MPFPPAGSIRTTASLMAAAAEMPHLPHRLFAIFSLPPVSRHPTPFSVAIKRKKIVSLTLLIQRFDMALLIIWVLLGALVGIAWVLTQLDWRCFFKHAKKRFLSLDRTGTTSPQGVWINCCNCAFSFGHRFRLRWICDHCHKMGETCWDETGEWKIEHGSVVPDEKHWTNRR